MLNFQLRQKDGMCRSKGGSPWSKLRTWLTMDFWDHQQYDQMTILFSQ